MKHVPFAADTYTTPPGREKLLHRLLLRSSIYYFARFIGVVLRYRSIALKYLDHATWSQASFEMIKVIEDCGGRFHIAGIDNVRKVDGPVVFVGNHMGMLETQVPIGMMYPYKNVVYVIKEQLRTVPLFGAYVQRCISVTRKSPAEDLKQVLKQGAEKIAGGCSVIIFPQATRSVAFIPEKFNSLGIKLAKRAGVPVIPVALKTDFWGNGRFLKDFGPLNLDKPIHFEFGEPIEITGNGKQEHEQVMEFIQTRLARWQIEDRQAREARA